MMKKMKGFTLAEVLTTLMVIGVVAAITIPMLMNSTDEQEHKAQYKKAMSVLSQGVSLMTAKEVTCQVSNSADLASCFLGNVLKGKLVNDTGANSGTKSVIMGTDGSAYKFVFNGTASNSKRSLKNICGSLSNLDYNGSDAKCYIVLDMDGFSKNATSFSSVSGSFAPGYVNGTDRQAVIIAGDGVKPVYVNGNDDVNLGFKWMYGEDVTPEGVTDGSTDWPSDNSDYPSDGSDIYSDIY